jgi:hypothetical protein
MGIVITIAVLMGTLAAVRKGRDRKLAKRIFDEDFMRSCRVAHQIAYVEYRANGIVLAKYRDGRWGIASRHGWMHLGKGRYSVYCEPMEEVQWSMAVYSFLTLRGATCVMCLPKNGIALVLGTSSSRQLPSMIREALSVTHRLLRREILSPAWAYCRGATVLVAETFLCQP